MQKNWRDLRFEIIMALVWFLGGYLAASPFFGLVSRGALIAGFANLIIGTMLLILINLDRALRERIYRGVRSEEDGQEFNWALLVLLAMPPVCFIAAGAWWALRLLGFLKY